MNSLKIVVGESHEDLVKKGMTVRSRDEEIVCCQIANPANKETVIYFNRGLGKKNDLLSLMTQRLCTEVCDEWTEERIVKEVNDMIRIWEKVCTENQIA